MTILMNAGLVEQDERPWLVVVGLIVVSTLLLLMVVMGAALNAEVSSATPQPDDKRAAIYTSLREEFVNDLPHWNAHIEEKTLTITFNAPGALFRRGDNQVSEHFKGLLADFFPRYMAVLEPYRERIAEVRIEGHTSSDWGGELAGQAYFLNMELSQERTRSVLRHVYALDDMAPHRSWIRARVAAVGLSSARPIYDDEGLEDAQRSRRVTFKVVTHSALLANNR